MCTSMEYYSHRVATVGIPHYDTNDVTDDWEKELLDALERRKRDGSVIGNMGKQKSRLT